MATTESQNSQQEGQGTLTWAQFQQVELRVGEITRAEVFKEARNPAYQLWVDFGPAIGIKRSSAQITDLYTCEELVGKRVIGVTNFPPKQIGPMRSEVLVTGFYTDAKAVVLAVPDKDVPLGARLA